MLEKLAKQTAVYGISTIVVRFLSYLLTPYYTRIFGQETYGIVTDIYALIPLALTLLTMGMESSYFRFSAKAEEAGGDVRAAKRRLFATTWGVTSLAAVVFFVLVASFRNGVAGLMGEAYAAHPEYVVWVGLIILFDVWACIPFSRLREQGRALLFVGIKALNVVMNVALAVAFGVAGLFATEFGVGWVFVANLIASVVTWLVILATVDRTLIGTFDDQPSSYFPGYVVTWRTSGDFGYDLHDLVTGEVTPLYASSVMSDTIALYYEDGRLKVFNTETGDLITDTTVEPVEGQQSVMMDNKGDGYVWLELRDNDNFETTATRVYGPEGLVSDLTHLQDKYYALNYLITTPEGRPLYCGNANAPSSNGSMCDVLDENGNIVFYGLGSCYSYYDNSLNQLPEHVFVAKRGFYYGWMDTDGKWLYCRSIFSSINADDEMGY